MTLVKAKLVKLSDGDPPTDEDTIPVQFNPSTLKLTLGNNVEGGQSPGRTQQQFTGVSGTTLAFDLVFRPSLPAEVGHVPADAFGPTIRPVSYDGIVYTLRFGEVTLQADD